jgi:hypothetical protein
MYLSQACISHRHVSLIGVRLSQACISHRHTSPIGMYLYRRASLSDMRLSDIHLSQVCIFHRHASLIGVCHENQIPYLLHICFKTILTRSAFHIGRKVALDAQAAAFVYIYARISQIAEMTLSFYVTACISYRHVSLIGVHLS